MYIVLAATAEETNEDGNGEVRSSSPHSLAADNSCPGGMVNDLSKSSGSYRIKSNVRYVLNKHMGTCSCITWQSFE
jgi:hypothetical protein